jgi:hypothetical protein
MWMEMRRGSGGELGPDLRIRTAHLREHTPGTPVETVATPAVPPYSITGDAAEEILGRQVKLVPSGRIAGTHSGYVEFERSSDGRGTFSAWMRYVDFSDNGRSVLNGVERSHGSMVGGAVYEAELELAGDVDGEMHLRASWSGLDDGTRLLFGTADDGRPQSYGAARYGGVVARVEDLVE